MGHRQIEVALESSGLAWTHLRPNFFMQNFGGANNPTIKQNGQFYLAAGDGKVSFIDVRDIGAVGAAVLGDPQHRGQALALTGPKSLDHQEAAKIIGEALGKPVSYVAIDDDAMRGALAQAGMPPAAVEGMSGLYAVVRAGWAAGVTDTVQQVLGRPPITFAQYARDNVAEWQ